MTWEEDLSRFQWDWPTVRRWADPYRAGESMQDRSSCPHTSPPKTESNVVKRIVSLRLRLREGPVQIAARVSVAPSTVHKILTRCRINRLSYTDRETGEPVRCYEHPDPGSMIHVDVEKLGNIPDGGRWRFVGLLQGDRNRAALRPGPAVHANSPNWGMRSSTSSSTTTPASPTPKSTTTKPQ